MWRPVAPRASVTSHSVGASARYPCRSRPFAVWARQAPASPVGLLAGLDTRAAVCGHRGQVRGRNALTGEYHGPWRDALRSARLALPAFRHLAAKGARQAMASRLRSKTSSQPRLRSHRLPRPSPARDACNPPTPTLVALLALTILPPHGLRHPPPPRTAPAYPWPRGCCRAVGLRRCGRGCGGRGVCVRAARRGKRG